MIETIAKRLKLNVTNIKSSLIFNNKKIKKINSEKNKFVLVTKNQEDVKKKESKIESSDRISVIQNIGKKLLSGPLSLIDKFKEFFGLILLGIVVNNLPTIVQKLQDIFGKIKTFFDQNPWIGNTIKFAFDIIGKGIMGLAKVIKAVRPYVGGSFKFALDTIKSTKNQIGSLIQTFDELDLSFGGLIKDLDVDKIPDVSKEPEKYSAFTAGGGKSAVKEKGQSVDEVIEQGRKNISKYDTKPTQPTQTKPTVQLQSPGSMYPKNPPVQKLQRGGTVGNIPPSEGTGRGGPSDVAKTAPYLLKPSLPRTPFARPGGTAIGRRTIRTVSYFEKFKENVSNSEETSKQNEKNNNSFFNILKKLNEIKNLRLKVKDDEGGGNGGDGGGGLYQRSEDIPLIGGPGIEGLSSFIAGAETGGRYDAYSGDGGKGDPAMLSMTLTELSKNYNMAVGAHQFMPSTAIGLARKIGLDPNKVVFTGETQDRLNRFHLNSMGYGDFINGSLSDKDFGRRIAQQYRALPDPYTGKTYDDQYAGRNNATRTWDQFKQALVDSKKSKNVSLRTAPGADPNLTSQFSPVSGTSGTVKYNGQENAAVNIPYSPFKNKTGNPRITSTVGYRKSQGKTHRGLDIAADPGTPLYAYLPGTVTKSGEYGDGYGYSFEWKDSKGNLHFFGHLQSAPFLQVGEEVKQGKNVGKVGSTGNSTDPHLHWEIRRSSDGKQYTDPVSWVKSFSLPKPTGPVEPTGGQQIIPNFSIPLGEKIHFRLGGVDYHAYKTRIGFDFYRGGSFGGIGATKVTNPNEEKQVTEAFIKYMESRRKPAVEPGTAAASLITPMSKNSDVIASINSNLNQQNGVVILNRTQPIIVNRVQTIAMTRLVETNSGNNNSSTASRIFAGARDTLGA